MEATNKRRENLTWPDEDETRKQLEAIRELAKELRTDYPTDTPQIWGSIRNQRLNRRNTLIRAQFSTDETAWHLINGSEWLELFDLLGFSVDKETRKRFASHLKWYSFWYADFKPRLSSKYAQRIHWYVHNFLFCLRNKLQTEKDYREGKYGSKGQAYFMEIEEQPATPAETPQISTETAEPVNISAEGEKEAESAKIAITSITQLSVLKYKLQHPKLKEWAVKYGLLDLVRRMYYLEEVYIGGFMIDNKFRQSLCENDKAIIAAVRKLIADAEKAA